jgi:hypothetical protein
VVEVRGEQAFMPMSAASFIVLMMVVVLAGHLTWSKHEETMNEVISAGSEKLVAMAGNIGGDLKLAAKQAIYEAAWGVCKRADDYSTDESRRGAIEELAGELLLRKLEWLKLALGEWNGRIELELGGEISIELEPEEEGFVTALVLMPGTSIHLTSWENDLSLRVPCENFRLFVDTRYFLLQDRMNDFISGGMEGVAWKWPALEYILAYSEAWTGAGVRLNELRSRALFELAWMEEELEKFGSADYLAMNCLGESSMSFDILNELLDAKNTVSPMRAVDLGEVESFIDRSISQLELAGEELREAEEEIKSAGELARSCENLDEVTETLKEKLSECASHLGRARTHVLQVQSEFGGMMELLSERRENPVVNAIFAGFSSGVGGYPSLEVQVSNGCGGVIGKISVIEDGVNSTSESDALSADSVSELEAGVSALTEDLLAEPLPKRWIEYTSYPEPGTSGEEREERVPIYIGSEEDGTIGALEEVIHAAEAAIENMGEISRLVEPAPEELELDETLIQRVLSGSGILFTQSREKLYEMTPPMPIREEPGISVFHDFRISRVEIERQDPFCFSPSPTPIPLWFIGVTLYYAQWHLTIELEENPVEEIFDFDNPSLLLHDESFGPSDYVHKPLAYRWEVPRMTFDFPLVVISLVPFPIISDVP